MAARYVWSGATGVGDGSSWTDAHTTMTAAITASAASDTFYVADDHSETFGASTTFAFKGAAGVVSTVLCVRRSGGSVPPVAADLINAQDGSAGAAFTCTGAFTLTLTGWFYMRGVRIRTGTGTSSFGGSFNRHVLERCQIWTGGNVTVNAASFMQTIWRNCTWKAGGTGHRLLNNNFRFSWW